MWVRRLCVVIAVMWVASSWVRPAWAIDVVGDDGADRYTGTGGLIMPASVPAPTRQRVAGCSGCRWRLVAPCLHRPDEGAQVACMSMVSGCPAGGWRLRVWLSEDQGVTWQDEGLMCVEPTGPVTVQDVDRALHDAFVRRLPPVALTAAPAHGVLPYLPVVFDSGQPAGIGTSAHSLLGRSVVLDPRARWHWEFGDGQVLDTMVPGSRYPDLAVSHAYGRGGAMHLALTVTWAATFTVDGLGPFPVVQPVHQDAHMIVQVGQARAVLVP